MKVGFIGLGLQGAPIAERIALGGYDLSVWARRKEVRDDWARKNVTVADSPQALSSSCDVVGLCVTADADVEQLVTDHILPSAKPGSLIIVHSTVGAETCVRLGELANKANVSLLDAPVSGGDEAARAGKLLVLVGGETVSYERALPIMSTFGNPILYLGQLGNALKMKIINNLVFTVNLAAAEHALRLGQALGMPQENVRAVLLNGSARSMGVEILPTVLANHAAHAAGLLSKDLGLASELSAQLRVPSDGFLRVANDLCARLSDVENELI